MADPFIAQITMFAGNFAPRSWAFCDGQLLPISSNTSLFSLLGTTYGGDGRTTFGLPDLRGRAPIGPRTGPGLTPRSLGQKSGAENTTLSINNMPQHNHTVTVTQGLNSKEAPADSISPVGTAHAQAEAFTTEAADSSLGAPPNVTIGNSGSSQGFNNMQPYLVINFIIALQGIFPSRN